MKEFLKKSGLWILALFILVSVIVSKAKNEKTQKQNIIALQSEISNFKLKDGTEVATVKSLQFENDQLKESLSQKEKEIAAKFSEVKTVTRIEERIKFDTIRIAYKDTIKCNFRRVGAIKNKSYSLDYITTQKGVKLSNLSVPDTIVIVTGLKRKWFLGKETATIDVIHTNELVKVNSIKHIENKPKKRWYDTNIFKIGAGFIAGAMLVK